MSVQEADISEWKGKSIQLKATPKMKAGSPLSLQRSTKRGHTVSLDSFNLSTSPKKFCAMAFQDLPTEDKETGNWADFTVALVGGA